jgi:hypothetical protein
VPQRLALPTGGRTKTASR